MEKDFTSRKDVDIGDGIVYCYREGDDNKIDKVRQFFNGKKFYYMPMLSNYHFKLDLTLPNKRHRIRMFRDGRIEYDYDNVGS